MSSDTSPLFGRRVRSNLEPQPDQTNDSTSIESISPLQQSNRALGATATRYEFSAPASLGSANSLTAANGRHGPEAPLSGMHWPNGIAAPPQGLFSRLQRQVQNILSDQVTPLRLAGHLSVLLVAATILILNRIEIPDWNIALNTTPASASSANSLSQSTGSEASGAGALAETDAMAGESLQRAAVPFTIIPERGREEMQLYVVEPGDTVLGIAEKFGLHPETVQWSNPELEANPDLLRIGDKLRILPVNGVIHAVASGDTLSSLASKYKTTVDQIVGYIANDITDAAMPLVVGSEIVVPGGTKPYVPRQVAAYSGPVPSSAFKGSGVFTWPASGSISQRFWSGHRAIDVGSWTGSPIKAADSGYVVIAGGGWNGGYGNHVVVDHGNGFTTLYAHLNSIYVRAGENVSRGEQIGTVGNTGNSTGPHLHFEIRYQGAPQNPFGYLP